MPALPTLLRMHWVPLLQAAPHHCLGGPDAVQVFESSRFLGKQGWRFAMQASMLEIYNEEYKDLLARKKLPDGKGHKVRCKVSCQPHMCVACWAGGLSSVA